jgi:aspartate-semialdehyde dehydrogenase
MSDWPTVGVAGARGVVGGVFLSILADAGLPAGSLRAFGSGEGTVAFGGGSVPVRPLTDEAARELDVLFLATDAATSRQIVEGPARAVPLIVDNSSAHRLDPHVPLVVPEANGHVLQERAGNLVANPNCTTAAAVVALAPIRDLAGLESVDLASYQAVSGAGRAGIDAFEVERAAGGTEQAEGSPARSARSPPRCARSWSSPSSTWPPPRFACRSTPATRWRCTSAPSVRSSSAR